MKKYIYILILSIIYNFTAVSCDDAEDYSGITLRNYLNALVAEANLKLAETTEGVEEGEYNAGSQDVYNQVIIEATAIYEDFTNSQQQVDEAYVNLLAAGETYFDAMVPFTSALVKTIAEANFLYNNTEEGTEEGNVEVGSKAIFKATIDKTQAFLDAGNYTQRELNEMSSELTTAIFAYEAKIIGAFIVPVENASFESPGFNTNNFDDIPGWNFGGKRKPWVKGNSQGTSKVGDFSLPEVTDGNFAVFFGNYTGGIWQKLGEGVHPGSTYEINFDASIKNSPNDFKGLAYDTFILSRVLVFNGADGDFSDVTILDEQYFNLGSEIDRDDFVNFTHSFTLPTPSPLLGKKMVLLFATFEGDVNQFNVPLGSLGPDTFWSETQSFMDNIVLKRK